MKHKLSDRMTARLFLLAKIVITLVSFSVLFRAVAWRDMVDVLKHLSLAWAGLAALAGCFLQAISAIRVVYKARAMGGCLSLKKSLRAHFIGAWFNQILPSGFGGDVVKMTILKKALGFGLAIRIVLLDRFSGLFFMFIMNLLLIKGYLNLAPALPLIFTLLLTLLSAGFLLTTVTASWAATHIHKKMGLSSPLRKALRLLMDIWIFRKGIYLWEQAWTSTLIHFSGIIAYAFLAQGLHIPVSFLDLVLLVPLISLISLIPISIAGWGLREMGAVWLFGLVGLSRADALALSITYGLSLMLSGIPGLYLFLKGRIQGFSATGIE